MFRHGRILGLRRKFVNYLSEVQTHFPAILVEPAVTMSDEQDSSTTRVFVSGLPPTFTSAQLRAHFLEKFPVTDAHVVNKRRIGFVGFPDHELAQKAARYFDRSFIRMSKISVDLAKPVDIQRDGKGQGKPTLRREGNGVLHTKEPLEAYGLNNTKKRKRAPADDGESVRSQETAVISKNLNVVTLPVQDRHLLQEVATVTENQDPDFENVTDDSHGQTEVVAVTKNQMIPETSSTENEQSTGPVSKSDLDWLRGKTSRVLDLVEPNEVGSAPETSQTSPTQTNEPQSKDNPANFDSEKRGEYTRDEQNISIPNGRLFVRNLPFTITKEDLEEEFAKYGNVEEVHLVRNLKTSANKGLAFVQFYDPSNAAEALRKLDGIAFQGRLIHILPALDKQGQKLTEFEISQLPLKKQKAIKRKSEASRSSFSWNSLYMNPDAVLASVATRLGVSKSDLLDPSSADAALKQAQAETSVIQETKVYLKANGVNVDAFKLAKRDDTTVLVKNFPYGTTSEELTSLLASFGTIQRFIFPPTGTMAIVQFQESNSAEQALKGLSYRNIKGSVLYLEKAPETVFDSSPVEYDGKAIDNQADATSNKFETADTNRNSITTLFIRNLNFATTNTRLTEIFKPLSGFLSAKVKTRTDSKRPGEILSMGFGFAEFQTKSQAEAAVATLDGHLLDGYQIVVRLSHKVLDAAEESRLERLATTSNSDRTKVIIKNLPFEATKKDIRILFGAYGQLRSVRMPKKFDSSTRGFAFADFVTAKEAKNAIEALSNTHFLGRRLVLDFAEGDAADPEAVIKAMEKKAGRDVRLSTVNRMMKGSIRKKFNADGREDE